MISNIMVALAQRHSAPGAVIIHSSNSGRAAVDLLDEN